MPPLVGYAANHRKTSAAGGILDGKNIRLRDWKSGDPGWIIHRHGVLYASEFGWEPSFEGLTARVVADFLGQLDPTREGCWIAELDGRSVGSVMIVRHPTREGVARLRLLLVEPEARGLGIGRLLVRHCADFAREKGYHTITLWTDTELGVARHLYESEGYRLVDESPHHEFGVGRIGQTWELEL